MREPFIGRDHELTTIRGLIGGARIARPQPLVVTGPAGIGRSTLLERAADDAAAEGMDVLRITGTDDLASEPFGALRRAVPAWVAATTDPALGALAIAATTAIRTRRDASGRRAAVIDALGRWLEAMTSRRPLLLAVDDLHLLDDDTARVVLFLARHLRAPRLLVLVARQPDPRIRRELDVDVRRFCDAGIADEITLGPFTDHDLDALVAARTGHRPDAHLVEVIRRRTGGQPFLATQLVCALVDDGLVQRSDGTVTARSGERALPHRVVSTVLGRFLRVGADARQVARVAALLGDVPVERLTTLASVAQLGEHRTGDAFDQLVAAGVLVDDGSTFRFRDELVRDAVVADLHPAGRRRLHDAIARVLADERRAGRPSDVTEVCEHLRRGPARRDPASASLLTEAGDAAVDSAPVQAAEWYRLALERSRPGGAQVPEIQVRLGRALALAGRPAQARAVASAAMGGLSSGPTLVQAVAVTALSAAATGRLQDASTLVDSALVEQRPADPRLVLHRAQLHAWTGQADAARRLADDARALGVPDGDPLLLTVRASAAVASGDVLVAAELANRLRRAPGRSPAARRRAALVTSGIAAISLDPADAIADVAAIDEGEPLVPWLRAAAAWAELRRGRLGEAMRHATAAWAVVERGVADVLTGLATLVIVRCHLERGDVTGAAGALAWADRAPDEPSAHLVLARARLRSSRGDHVGAADLLRRVEERAEVAGRVDRSALVLAEQVESAHAAGRTDAMRAANARLQALPRSDGAVALTMSCLAAEALTTRDPDRAMDARSYALDHDLALEAARALALAGDVRRDVDALAAAHDELGRLGAAAGQRQVAAQLRALGRQPSPRRARSSGALTERELAVAELVAGGLTNREVAARVHVSEKTVEVHVSRIYAKTGCRSRVELAVAVRAGTLASSA